MSEQAKPDEEIEGVTFFATNDEAERICRLPHNADFTDQIPKEYKGRVLYVPGDYNPRNRKPGDRKPFLFLGILPTDDVSLSDKRNPERYDGLKCEFYLLDGVLSLKKLALDRTNELFVNGEQIKGVRNETDCGVTIMALGKPDIVAFGTDKLAAGFVLKRGSPDMESCGKFCKPKALPPPPAQQQQPPPNPVPSSLPATTEPRGQSQSQSQNPSQTKAHAQTIVLPKLDTPQTRQRNTIPEPDSAVSPRTIVVPIPKAHPTQASVHPDAGVGGGGGGGGELKRRLSDNSTEEHQPKATRVQQVDVRPTTPGSGASPAAAALAAQDTKKNTSGGPAALGSTPAAITAAEKKKKANDPAAGGLGVVSTAGKSKEDIK
ncbi:hypothetical protein B0T24DRAFT_679129 [Lasiosphaeria ovina]|uniref:Uncharacterized protein n=1 Tax=Lasiosphaeria ovina TaxID=92902 RepID=A0AAE0KBM1_9PEZI|nr:hypothetical protein B0T24DRAFT_679129 [Lasiosphaeria ovina]